MRHGFGFGALLCAGLLPPAAAAQTKERIACEVRTSPSGNQHLMASMATDVLDGKVVRSSVRRSFSVSYTARSYDATPPLSVTDASISASWPMPGTNSSITGGMLGSATGRELTYSPTLDMRLRVPVGGRLPRQFKVRFSDGVLALAELTASFRVVEGESFATASLRVSLPAEVQAYRGSLGVEIVGLGDGSRVAYATFLLAGFQDTSWHGANRNVGITIAADGTPGPLASGCTRREASARRY